VPEEQQYHTWRRSTVAYKRGSFVMSWKPVLHCEMATKEGTSRRARMAKMISLQTWARSPSDLKSGLGNQTIQTWARTRKSHRLQEEDCAPWTVVA